MHECSYETTGDALLGGKEKAVDSICSNDEQHIPSVGSPIQNASDHKYESTDQFQIAQSRHPQSIDEWSEKESAYSDLYGASR